MKYWTALSGLLLATAIGFGGFIHWTAFAVQTPDSETGESRVTQAKPTTTNSDYDVNFGESWQSVRIFRLLKPLDKPLKVYVETHPKRLSLYRPSYRHYVVESLKAWDKALDGRLKYSYTNNKKEADITVDWVPSFEDRYVAGLTTYRVGHATIEIKTVGVPEADIQGNILHEFGHALGISGHSSDPDDMMVGTRKWHRDNTPYHPQLSSRDVQAIKHLYSTHWRKGEDLYATAAQKAVTETIATEKTARQAITLEPADDTALIHSQAAQTKEAQGGKQAHPTQNFPKK